MTNVWCSRMQAVIKSKLITRFFVVFLAPMWRHLFQFSPRLKVYPFVAILIFSLCSKGRTVSPQGSTTPCKLLQIPPGACAFPWYSPVHVMPQWPWAHCRLREGGLPCWRLVVEKLLIKNKILPSVTSLTWQLNQNALASPGPEHFQVR